MTRTRSSSNVSSDSSSLQSVHSSTFLLAPTAILNEKFPSLPRPRTLSIASIASFGNLRRRGLYLILLTVIVGVLSANLFFNFAVVGGNTISYDNFQHYLSHHLNSHAYSNPIDNTLLAGSKPPVVALVSFSSRSRAEVLDCYLQQNLISNGGLLDRVIFSSETSSEEDLDWLRYTVTETEGYNLIGSLYDGTVERYVGLSDKIIPLQEIDNIPGSVGRSWKVAAALARNIAQLSGPEGLEPLFIFVNAETIYLSPTTIASMIYTQQTQPEYSIVQANVVNQQVLSWLHNRMGVVKPYRPQGNSLEAETELLPPEPNSNVFDDLWNQLNSIKTEKRSASSSFPWRASELPLWSLEDAAAFTSSEASTVSPLLFGVPIDFQPPAYKQRWLPYDERQMHQTSAINSLVEEDMDFHQRPSLSTPLTQSVFSLTGPGKWPWTVSAQQLYSFLEHLEEEHELSQFSDTNSTQSFSQIRGLARYHLPLWTFSTSPPLSPTLFLVSASDLQALTPSFPFHIEPASPTGSAQDNEEPTLARWITSETVVTQYLNGRGAVVDGHAIAARFLPGSVGRSDRSDVEGEEVRRGLESTDLLERFWGYAGEVGCRVRL
jgi:hypothetical protein